jgi:hypothetical protein
MVAHDLRKSFEVALPRQPHELGIGLLAGHDEIVRSGNETTTSRVKVTVLNLLRSLGGMTPGSPEPATVRAVIERIEREP